MSEEKTSENIPVVNKNLQLFVKSVTFTGNTRFLSSNRGRRVAWTVAISVAFLLLSYQLGLVFLDYREFKVNTVIRNEMYSFEFPDVTICQMQPYKSHVFSLDAAKKFWLYLMYGKKAREDSVKQEYNAFYMAFVSSWEHTYNKDIYSNIFNNIFACMYQGDLCSLADFHITRHPVRRNCLTFSPKKRSSTETSQVSGLSFILRMGNGYFPDFVFKGAVKLIGYEVYIHEKGTKFPTRKDSISLRPWRQTIVSLTMKQYINIQTPLKRCFTDSGMHKSYRSISQDLMKAANISADCDYYARVTQDDCGDLWKNKRTFKHCQCFDETKPLLCQGAANVLQPTCMHLPRRFFYNDGVNLNSGTLVYKNESTYLPTDALFRRVNTTYACYFDGHAKLWEKQNIKCLRPCRRTAYSFNTFSRKWPLSKSSLRYVLKEYYSLGIGSLNNNQYQSEINDSFATITIFPSDLSVDVVEEYLAYTTSQLFADFGGTIGLWIGCSYLTFVELLEYFVIAFARLITLGRKRIFNSQPELKESPLVELDDLELSDRNTV